MVSENFKPWSMCVCVYRVNVTVSNDSAIFYDGLITLYWHTGQLYKSVFLGGLNRKLP